MMRGLLVHGKDCWSDIFLFGTRLKEMEPTRLQSNNEAIKETTVQKERSKEYICPYLLSIAAQLFEDRGGCMIKTPTEESLCFG